MVDAVGGAGPARLRRDVGLVGLTFVSLGSIIGSGWLLGALGAAKVAGPASLLSWILAGLVIVVLALIHAELGAAYPVSGGTARFPHFVFGPLGGFTAGWMAWLGSVTLAPIEVEAALQYLSNKIPDLIRLAGAPPGTPVLTGWGLVAAAVLMLGFTLVNILGVRWLSETNKAAVWWKVLVPLLTIVVLFFASFHASNFHAGGGFMPFGMKGVFSALPAGVVFAVMGFEQAIQLGGEARNPRRDVPRAVIGSMLIGTVIYLLLELVFIAALDPNVIAAHGWLAPIEKGAFGPYAGLATTLGLGWLSVILYIDAFVSPAGTGLIYTGTSSRLTYALSRNGYVHTAFERLSPRGVPVFSVLFSFVVGLILFLPFPGWQELVGFVTSATVLMYAFAPVSFAALRRTDPDRERPYRLRAGGVLAPVAFIASDLIVYWSGWKTDAKLFLAVLAGFVLLALSYLTKANPRRPRIQWRPALWIGPWLGGMALISWLGQFDGRGVIPFWVDIVVVAVFSLVIFVVASRVALTPEQVAAFVAEEEHEAGLNLPPEQERPAPVG